jgi:hypothetical protein
MEEIFQRRREAFRAGGLLDAAQGKRSPFRFHKRRKILHLPGFPASRLKPLHATYLFTLNGGGGTVNKTRTFMPPYILQAVPESLPQQGNAIRRWRLSPINSVCVGDAPHVRQSNHAPEQNVASRSGIAG